MEVHAEDLRVARDQRARLVGGEAELRALVRGPDRGVRLGVDPGRDAHEQPRRAGRARPLELVGRVEDDEGRRGGGELVVALVVAVQDEPLVGNPGRARERDLAERGDVGAEPFLREHAQQRDVREGLRPVGDERAGRRGAIRARLRAKGLLAVDDERRAELLGEGRGGDAAERELAVSRRGR